MEEQNNQNLEQQELEQKETEQLPKEETKEVNVQPPTKKPFPKIAIGAIALAAVAIIVILIIVLGGNKSSNITCGSCGESISEGVKFCPSCGNQTSDVPSNNCTHDWVWESATVTCSKDGYDVYRCSKCNGTKQESASAYGCYDYDNDGYCNDCNTYIGISAIPKWISNRSISHQDDMKAYRFCFALKDEYETYIACNATIEMSIVNDLGETVYQGTKYVKTSDYGEWYNIYGTWLGTAVYIYDSEITPGLVEDGTFYYKVIAGDIWFDYSLDVSDLPTYTPSFSIGEKWVVNGEWELTILNAELHRDCEDNTSMAQYVLITYSYKNLGNKNSSGLAFTNYDFNVYDGNGNIATKCTCWDHTKSAEWIDVGTTATASVLFGFNSSTSTIKIVASHYDSNYNTISANFTGTISTCNHSYENGKCNEIAKCDICGATTGNILGHDYSVATCTQASKCSRCGQTTGSVSEHSYANATCTTPKTCTVCGTTQGDALNHNYISSNYSKCTRCGEIKPDYYLEYGLGDTFIFEDTSKKMEITIGTIATVVEVPDWIHTENYCPSGFAVRVPITIKNLGTETTHISEYWDYKLFTPDGAEVINTTCFEYAYDDCLNSDDVRPNGSITKYIYFNYTENGEYVIEFDATKANQITVLIDASKCEHVGDEGVCTSCGKVTDAKLALALYIIKNGSKLSEGNRYIISKTITENGSTMTGYIEFDYDNLQFVFSMLTKTSSGADTFVTMDLDIGNSQQDVSMTFTSNGITCAASGTILSNSFSVSNKYIYYFKCNSSSLSSELKSLLGTSTAGMLALCGQMIQETETGVTISMLGIKNF